MSRLGLAVHRFRTDALEVAGRVISWAGSNGYEVVVDESDISSLRTTSVTSGDVGDVDVVVSIGGDGTMLRSVHALNGRTVPLIGVNLGQLGYLAVVEDDEVIEALMCGITVQKEPNITMTIACCWKCPCGPKVLDWPTT